MYIALFAMFFVGEVGEREFSKDFVQDIQTMALFPICGFLYLMFFAHSAI